MSVENIRNDVEAMITIHTDRVQPEAENASDRVALTSLVPGLLEDSKLASTLNEFIGSMLAEPIAQASHKAFAIETAAKEAHAHLESAVGTEGANTNWFKEINGATEHNGRTAQAARTAADQTTLLGKEIVQTEAEILAFITQRVGALATRANDVKVALDSAAASSGETVARAETYLQQL